MTFHRSLSNKKAFCINPPSPNLGGEKVFFDISKIAHNASNFLYIKKGGTYSFFSALTSAAVPSLLMGLFHMVLTVILPLIQFIGINSEAREDITGNTPTADKLFGFIIYGTSNFLDTAIIYIILGSLGLLSVLTAVKVFSFICDKRTVNVYYSLGIKRTTLFITRYGGGALALATATAAPFILSYLVNLIFLGASLELSFALFHLFIGFYVFSLICYSVTSAVFSSVGTVSEAQIYSVAVVFAPTAIMFVVQQIITAFLPSAAYGVYVNHFSGSSYAYGSSESLLERTESFNPLLFFTDDINTYSCAALKDEKLFLKNADLPWSTPETYKLLPWFAVCVAISCIGLLLFKRIKAENCGFLNTNKILSNIVTFGMCLAGMSLFLGEMRWESPVIVIGFGVIIALILYLAMEIFLKRSFKKVLKASYKFAAHMVIVAIIFGIFSSGAFGYDKYIPDREKVESAEISVPFSYSQITTMSMNCGWNADMFIRVFEPYDYRYLPVITDEKDIDTLMDIHRQLNENDTEDGIQNSIMIRYNYKNGGSCERLIDITGREEVELLFTFFDMQSYKNELYNLFYKENRLEEILEEGKNGKYVDERLISALCFEYEFSDVLLRTNSLNENIGLNLSEEEFSALKDALYKDIYGMTAKEYLTGEAKQLGVLSLSVNEKAYKIEGINGYNGEYDPYIYEDETVVTVPDKNEEIPSDGENTENEELPEDDISGNKPSETPPVNTSDGKISDSYEGIYDCLGNFSSSGSYDTVITEDMKNTVEYLDSLGLLGMLTSEYEIESVTLCEVDVYNTFNYYSNLNNRNFMLEFFAYGYIPYDYYGMETDVFEKEMENYGKTVTDKKEIEELESKMLLHAYTFNSGYFCLVKYTNGSCCVKYINQSDIPSEIQNSL